jgi:hypothetical protein
MIQQLQKIIEIPAVRKTFMAMSDKEHDVSGLVYDSSGKRISMPSPITIEFNNEKQTVRATSHGYSTESMPMMQRKFLRHEGGEAILLGDIAEKDPIVIISENKGASIEQQSEFVDKINSMTGLCIKKPSE